MFLIDLFLFHIYIYEIATLNEIEFLWLIVLFNSKWDNTDDDNENNIFLPQNLIWLKISNLKRRTLSTSRGAKIS